MSGGAKIVQIPRAGYLDAVLTLRRLADQIESGELPACDVGVLAMLGAHGGVDVFGFGPQSKDLQCIATLRLAEHHLISTMLAPDGE